MSVSFSTNLADHLSIIYAVSNYKPPDREKTYRIEVEKTRNGLKKNLLNDSLFPRGQGKMMALIARKMTRKRPRQRLKPSSYTADRVFTSLRRRVPAHATSERFRTAEHAAQSQLSAELTLHVA